MSFRSRSVCVVTWLNVGSRACRLLILNVSNRFQTCGIGSELEELAVGDVAPAVDAGCDTFGIEVFSAGGLDFVAVGDHEGLLIVVHDQRIWFPTTTATPADQPLSVRLTATATTGSAQVGHATATAG